MQSKKSVKTVPFTTNCYKVSPSLGNRSSYLTSEGGPSLRQPELNSRVARLGKRDKNVLSVPFPAGIDMVT